MIKINIEYLQAKNLDYLIEKINLLNFTNSNNLFLHLKLEDQI